jgi:hypothetical protein
MRHGTAVGACQPSGLINADGSGAIDLDALFKSPSARLEQCHRRSGPAALSWFESARSAVRVVRPAGHFRFPELRDLALVAALHCCHDSWR